MSGPALKIALQAELAEVELQLEGLDDRAEAEQGKVVALEAQAAEAREALRRLEDEVVPAQRAVLAGIEDQQLAAMDRADQIRRFAEGFGDREVAARARVQVGDDHLSDRPVAELDRALRPLVLGLDLRRRIARLVGLFFEPQPELADAIEQHMPDGWYTRGQKAWRNAVRTTLAAEVKAGRVLKRAGRGSQVYNLKGGAR